MIRVGIMGGSGYTGLELLRILTEHPEVEIRWVSSESYQGKTVEQYCPAWRGRKNRVFCSTAQAIQNGGVDLVFLALPHGSSMQFASQFLTQGVRVIDLGADFRLKNVSLYQKYYEIEHQALTWLTEAVYGIPEIYREEIRKARLVANPGCYPTSVLIPLYPLIREKTLEPTLVVDSKSGVTGAGKKPTENSHFGEVDENFKAYKVGNHRHLPEIKEQLKNLYQEEVSLIFTPHLLPLKRGILSTIYLNLRQELAEEELIAIWKKYYQNERWVRIYPLGSLPETKWVVGSNFCDLGLVKVDSKKVVIVSCIDNLTKGASGQAVQNMNLMFGLGEETALPSQVLYP